MCRVALDGEGCEMEMVEKSFLIYSTEFLE